MHKFVDDCTLTEIMEKLNTIGMQLEINSVESYGH